MSDQPERQSAAGGNAKSRPAHPRDHRAKLIFLGLVVAIMLVVYFCRQWGGQALLPDWPTDLGETLRQARQDSRSVVAFFFSTPPSDAAKTLVSSTLGKSLNRKAIDKGGFLRVKVVVAVGLKDETSRRFALRQLPTMLLLGPDGQELNRREGMIGEVDFAKGFLDRTRVEPPPATAPEPVQPRGQP